jgi:hypothetical protein
VTYGDYDNDGDLDVLVINLNARPRLLRNQGGNGRSWLMIDARLAEIESVALGARIKVTSGSLEQIRDLIPVTGFLSQADPRCHFGLGSASQADQVEIRWPNGRTTRLSDVPANQMLKVIQPSESKEN